MEVGVNGLLMDHVALPVMVEFNREQDHAIRLLLQREEKIA